MKTIPSLPRGMRCHANAAFVVTAFGVAFSAATAAPTETPATPNTATPAAPTALWIPQQGKDNGFWLLLSADRRVLRDDLKDLLGFKVLNGQVLPAPAQDQKGRWGFLDTQGQWAMPPAFDVARNFADEDGLARFKQNGLWGYIGTDLKIRVKPTWPNVGAFFNGRAAVQSKDEKWGVIDSNGTVVVPPKYRLIGPYGRNGLARAATGDQWSYIDPQGATRFRAGKDLALDFDDFDVAPVEVDDKWGLMDAKGNWVIKPSLEHIDEFQAPGLAAFQRNYKNGYLDLQGREVIPVGDLSEKIGQGLIRAGSLGSSRFSFIDTRGKTAIAGPFDWVGDFDTKGAIPARQKGRWGLLNAKGQWVAVEERREPVPAHKNYRNEIQGGLSTWLHAGQALEWKNDQGQTVYRLTQKTAPGGKQFVLQMQAGDKIVWTSAPQSASLPLTPFFEPRAQDLVGLADEALIAEAKRMLGALPRHFLPYSLVFAKRRSPYDLKDLDDDEKEQIKKGAMTTLAETYVGEEDWGTYYFLSEQRGELFERIATQACQTLQSAFGKPLALKDDDAHWQGRAKRCVWQQGNRQLMVVDHHETGDGDFERQVSLVVVQER